MSYFLTYGIRHVSDSNEDIHCSEIVLISTYLIVIFFETQKTATGGFL